MSKDPVLAADAVRIVLNLVLAAGQIAATALLFRDGFATAQGPLPQTGPTPIEPAGYAFIIWGPIYLGALAFAAVQALQPNWTAPLFRDIGWLTAAAFLACILWLAAARYGPLLATAPLIILMLVCLGAALIRASASPGTLGPVEGLAVHAGLGLYAGWLTVAVFANISEVLPAYGFDRFGLGAETWTRLLLAAASVLALLGLWASGGNLFYAGAIIWALAAIAVANLQRGPNLTVAGLAAGAALLILFAAFVTRQLRASA
jgi:hypothetical protein